MPATKTATPASPTRVDLPEHDRQRPIELLNGRLAGATAGACSQVKQARWSVNAARARTIVRQWRRFALVLLLPVSGIGDIQTTTQTMSANVSPNGKLSIPASIDLRSPDTRFGTLAGSLTVSYWARTSASGGGSVTVQANSDFSPAGGPSISAVSFTCSGATLGAGCSGSQPLATLYADVLGVSAGRRLHGRWRRMQCAGTEHGPANVFRAE